MRNLILVGLMVGTAACGGSSAKSKAPPTARTVPAPASPAPVASAKPTPPASTKPNPHELFQAAAASGDVALMTRINIEVGIADKDGVPNDAMEEFMNAHMDWAMANAQWIMDNATDPAKAVEWLRVNYDATLSPAGAPAKLSPKAAATAKRQPHELFQAAAASGDVAIMTRVNAAIGITDGNGVPNDTMEAFMNDHTDWAMAHAQWIMDNATDPALAVAWLRLNFDPSLTPLPPEPVTVAPRPVARPPAKKLSAKAAAKAAATAKKLPHELFQAAAAAGEVDMMTRVNVAIGIADQDGVPNDTMETFMNEHTDWAMAHAQWIMDNAVEPAKAAAWLRTNFDPNFQLSLMP